MLTLSLKAIILAIGANMFCVDKPVFARKQSLRITVFPRFFRVKFCNVANVKYLIERNFMAIRSSLSDSGKSLTISIDGRFDASSLDEFRRSYEDVKSELRSYTVDLKETVHLDSSALGMLLVLRDFAGGDQADITIANCSPEVKKIFTISSFEQLFSIQ